MSQCQIDEDCRKMAWVCSNAKFIQKNFKEFNFVRQRIVGTKAASDRGVDNTAPI